MWSGMMMARLTAAGRSGRVSGQPITELVNGTFRVHAAGLPLYCRKLAAKCTGARLFRAVGGGYALTLLTMIKIVLIESISFDRPSQ
jgi:hypothetical protein